MSDNDMKHSYDKGFADRCAKYGIDPEELIGFAEKQAQASSAYVNTPYGNEDYGINVWDSGLIRAVGNTGRNIGRLWGNLGEALANNPMWGGGQPNYRPMLGLFEDPTNGADTRNAVSAKAWLKMSPRARMGLVTGKNAGNFAPPNWREVERLEAEQRKKDAAKFRGGMTMQEALDKRQNSIYRPWHYI